MSNVNDIIKKSGNTFHYQVVHFLRERGWTVLVSPYYSDYVSDKSKEIDIIAEKGFDVKQPGLDKWLGKLVVKLFIECKYITSDIVFWFDEKDRDRARMKVVRETPLKEANVYTQKHHYLADDEVAKLFTPNANNDDIFYKALNQVLNSMIYYRSENIASIFPAISKILCTLKYPLILCNDFSHLHRVEAGQTAYSKINESFQLEVNYAFLSKDKNSKSDYFLIDVIDFNQFDRFLNGPVKTDVDTVCYVLT